MSWLHPESQPWRCQTARSILRIALRLLARRAGFKPIGPRSVEDGCSWTGQSPGACRASPPQSNHVSILNLGLAFGSQQAAHYLKAFSPTTHSTNPLQRSWNELLSALKTTRSNSAWRYIVMASRRVPQCCKVQQGSARVRMYAWQGSSRVEEERHMLLGIAPEPILLFCLFVC